MSSPFENGGHVTYFLFSKMDLPKSAVPLERKGRPRFEPDLEIAAIALRRRLTVVAGNVRHFKGIPGLKVESRLV
jgi:hypothetical protein